MLSPLLHKSSQQNFTSMFVLTMPFKKQFSNYFRNIGNLSLMIMFKPKKISNHSHTQQPKPSPTILNGHNISIIIKFSLFSKSITYYLFTTILK